MLNQAASNSKIIVAPLNWGLGHATRCIPIIKRLMDHGAQVIIACGTSQYALLHAEFPRLRFIHLPGYELKYGDSRVITRCKIIFQIPKILIRIKSENRWLRRFIDLERPDGLISDNRYGLHSSRVPCIFMTHQLNIYSGFGWRLDRILQQINYRLICRFAACWIPDSPQKPGLAGSLSHPEKLPGLPVDYIGSLSRFQASGQPFKKGELLVLLSGPEPQRTILENKILDQIKAYPGRVNLVRGLPGDTVPLKTAPHISAHNHLPASELYPLLTDAEFVICRSGYSSIMDLAALGKKSIVIPTPGQAEQEYLAKHLVKQNLVFSVTQENFSLDCALEAARHFPYATFPMNSNDRLGETVHAFLNWLNRNSPSG
jgi:UDP-N-acetylglucosamine transferase subunit ALG13